MTPAAPAKERLASNGIAEDLKDITASNSEWDKERSTYLVHHSLLQDLPGSHESVVHWRLQRMEDALDKMYRLDGGQHLPYEFYAEGIAHVQEEVEVAEYAAASAPDPLVDNIPLGAAGSVPYRDFVLTDPDSWFSESSVFLAHHSGEISESDEWCAARRVFLGCHRSFESREVHSAHALFCVRRAQQAFETMEQESRQRHGVDESGFYETGSIEMAHLIEAAEHAAASAPDISEADRRARERVAK